MPISFFFRGCSFVFANCILSSVLACPVGYKCTDPDVSPWKYGTWASPSGAYADSEEGVIEDIIASIALNSCNISYIPGGGRYLTAGEPDPGCRGGLTPTYLGLETLQCNTAIETFRYAAKTNCASPTSINQARLFRKRTVSCPEGFEAYQDFCAKYIYPKITINGISATQALPSLNGPVKLTISIDRDGEFLPNHSFGISIVGVGELGAVTNNEGHGEYIYIPPYIKSVDVEIAATCRTCSNKAVHHISVFAAEEPGPQMCRP